VSFLEFNEQGLISGCTDMVLIDSLLSLGTSTSLKSYEIHIYNNQVEPTVKTGFFQLPLLRVVSAILGTK